MNQFDCYRTTYYFYEPLTKEEGAVVIPLVFYEMPLVQSGVPFSERMEMDWATALERSGCVGKSEITENEAYDIAFQLICIMYEGNVSKPQDLFNIIKRMKDRDPKILEYWASAIERAKTDHDGAKLILGKNKWKGDWEK